MNRYMVLAAEVAKWSKHPDFRVGAVAVGDYGQILSTGYNGWPRGMVNEEQGRDTANQHGYSLTIHAESNLVCNANLTGTRLQGSTAYITVFPCSHCSLLLAQVGIAQVVVPKIASPPAIKGSWEENMKRAGLILKDTGVEVTLI